MMMADPFVLIEGPNPDDARLFRRPKAILRADRLHDVRETLALMEQAQQAGHHLAGYLAYEAGYAFEPGLRDIAPIPSSPLVCFGVFDEPERLDWGNVAAGGSLFDIEAEWSEHRYSRRFERALSYIGAGDIYQVNLTFPLKGRWDGDPLALYARLRRHQQAPFGALVALGETAILSFSPELFFERAGRAIRVRPMKGTAPRGTDLADDDRLASALAASEKNRAENLMIVDLLRNDLGRIAEQGSVKVTDLFTVERYPTVLQMTSGVEAQLRDDIGLAGTLAALFPCGSITGAPKIRAMQIIRELEDRPRGVYCGSIGHVRPDGDARFNVAIRTATLAADGEFVFNVGSGVVSDSTARAEYEECLLKARFLHGEARISA